MKKALYIVGLVMACSACDFLETDTYDFLDESNIYQNVESCKAGLAGVYDMLGNVGCYGQNLWGDLDAGTDIMVYNRPAGKNAILVANYNYNNTDNALKATWTALYEGINRANDYIAKITEKTDQVCGGEKNKKMFLGEAKAVRAIYYMNLLAYWGEVPLRLTPTKDLSTQLLKKASQTAVYAQIIADLEDAVEGCLSVNELAGPGHVSKTAALALLARAYMWQAGYPVKANTWGKALEYARQVKESGLHSLTMHSGSENGYHELFIKMSSNQYDLSRESMLEVEFYGNGLDQTNETGRLGLFNGVQQQAVSENYPYAYGFYDGTKYLFRLYEEQDERRWWNITDYKYESKNGVVREVKYSPAELKKREDGNCAKWRAKYIPERPLSRNNSSINFPIIRYADVLLMIAECANEVAKQPTAEAINAVNEVRVRAGASPVAIGDFDYESFQQFVRDERTRELCYEVPRRMELRRHGADYFKEHILILKDQSLNEQNKMIGYDLESIKALPAINFAEKHIYFPIPQVELNTNTICGQTTGW